MIDVVTPFSPEHTSKKQLERCKKSVEAQNVETNHIIIVDDEQKGVSWARNKGLEKSENRFVAFLDADDQFKKVKLQEQKKRLKHSSNGFSITNSEGLNGSKPGFREDLDEKDFIQDLILDKISGVTSSIMLDKEEIGTVPLFRDLYRFEDHEYILRLYRLTGLELLEKEFVLIEKNNNGLSACSRQIPMIKSRIKMLEEKKMVYPSSFENLFRKELSKQYRWLARNKAKKQKNSLTQLYVQSFSYYPSTKTFGSFFLDKGKITANSLKKRVTA